MYFQKGGHLTDEGIALYVDALKLTRLERLPAEIRQHVMRCRRCKQEILELDSLLDDRHYKDIRNHPVLGQTGRPQTFVIVYRIAASVLIVVGLGAVAYWAGVFGSGHGAGPSPATGVTATANQQIQHASPDSSAGAKGLTAQPEPFAANFEPSVNLEGVVNGTLRSEDVDVKSPGVGEAVGQSIAFRWETRLRPPFVLRVVSNREFEVARVTLREKECTLQNSFAPGLYYWKLESRGELLYVGKFLVKK